MARHGFGDELRAGILHSAHLMVFRQALAEYICLSISRTGHRRNHLNNLLLEYDYSVGFVEYRLQTGVQ